MIGIRAGTESDAAAVRQVHLAAFPSPDEAGLVDALLGEGDAEISLVAEEGGVLAGHIMLSRMTVEADGRPVRALALAPVSVLPERQGKRIGSRLIEAAVELARARGEQMIFLLGDPAYYARFGFSRETAAPFASPYAGEYWQALALAPGFVSPASGKADYAPAFAALNATSDGAS